MRMWPAVQWIHVFKMYLFLPLSQCLDMKNTFAQKQLHQTQVSHRSSSSLQASSNATLLAIPSRMPSHVQYCQTWLLTATAIVHHRAPKFSSPLVCCWHKVLYSPLSRGPLTSKLDGIVLDKQTKLKTSLSNAENLSVTVDIWSDHKLRGFLGVTAHWLESAEGGIVLKSAFSPN